MTTDSQSDPSRASQVARQLILNNNDDMILTTSTPETTNPVKPTQSFQYCTVFFFGLKEFQETFVPMWNRLPNNKNVACQYPNDADGNAFRGGFEPLIKASGCTVVDGGGYTDYSSMIAKFKAKNCEIFSNSPIPPAFNTFWKQAAQQGWKPKLATVAKVLLFPPTPSRSDRWSTTSPPTPVGALHALRVLTGRPERKSARGCFPADTGSQWVQSIGSTYSLFEVAREAFTAVNGAASHEPSLLRCVPYRTSGLGRAAPAPRQVHFAIATPIPAAAFIEPARLWMVTGALLQNSKTQTPRQLTR